jgi:hypothetical protein
VSEIKWRHMMKWLDVRAGEGVVVHLSPLLRGLGPFADVALSRIPPEVLAASPEGRAALEVLSAGGAGDLIASPLKPSQLLATVRARGRSAA